MFKATSALCLRLTGRLTLAILCCTLLAGFARAQDSIPDGQLDVPYVPTPPEVVELMLQMAQVQPDDYLIDLGSGDGRIVIAAAKDYGVKQALGVDLDPQRIEEAEENARAAKVEDRVRFEQGDLFEQDLSEATVLTMYLLSSVNMQLRPVILETLEPGTRVVSHAFNMGDWQPDRHEQVNYASVYLWIVPAKVDGTWQLNTERGEELLLDLDQQFQEFEGTARLGKEEMSVTAGQLNGREIRFTLNNEEYVGRVEDDRMIAVAGPDTAQGWQARRL